MTPPTKFRGGLDWDERDWDAIRGGQNTCPVCHRTHEVTMFDDVSVPVCGCYDDQDDHELPCERCGINHALNCSRMPAHDPSHGERFVVHPVDVKHEGVNLGAGSKVEP